MSFQLEMFTAATAPCDEAPASGWSNTLAPLSNSFTFRGKAYLAFVAPRFGVRLIVKPGLPR